MRFFSWHDSTALADSKENVAAELPPVANSQLSWLIMAVCVCFVLYLVTVLVSPHLHLSLVIVR